VSTDEVELDDELDDDQIEDDVEPEEEDEDYRYTMTVDLSVIESLGINLYSNAAAVLSELVANAWDADATLVTIDWKQDGDLVVVTDDGVGMSVKALNKRFLKVGYKKRENEGTLSKNWSRQFMGRKGIGKLSVFSIARTVTVYSTRAGESNGLKIVTSELETAIKQHKPYHPEPVEVPEEYAKRGTTLVLDDLKTQRADLTAGALRKRIARRFDVLDETPRQKGGFYIRINDKEVTYADRQELKNLEFIWEFGNGALLPDETLPKVRERFIIDDAVVDATRGWKVEGWFGTVETPSQLFDDEAGSLKNIIVLARKRPIQEGIVGYLDFSKLFGNYVTGQIEADFLDLDDGYEDIATSDRQRLIEDDERVVALIKFLRAAFNKAAEQWSEVRPKKHAEDVLARYPKIRQWVDTRPEWQREPAERMLGTIAGLEIEGADEPRNKADLFRAGVLAFERVGLRQASTDLEQLSNVTAENLLPLLGQQGAYEAGLWVDILRSRVEAIDQLSKLSEDDALEKVLQEHLFDNLWLLDPSWERAAGDLWIEQNLKKIEPGLFAEDPEGEPIEGRIDIRYRKTSGQHVIVELKKYGVTLGVEKLEEQGLKYRTALANLLQQQQRDDTDIVVVFVLGRKPRVANRGRFDNDDDFIRNRFDSLPGRYVLYDALIGQAKYQYEEYLKASDKARALDEMLGTWGAELPEADKDTETIVKQSEDAAGASGDESDEPTTGS
jgi:hypothetical protein